MWLTMSAIPIFHPREMLHSGRLLHTCIGVSIVVHALLMLYSPGFEPPPPPISIKVTLRATPAVPIPEVRQPEAAPPPPAAAHTPAARPTKPIVERAPTKSASAPVVEMQAVATPIAAPVPPPAETKSAAPVTELKDTPRVPTVTTPGPVEPSESQLIQAYAAQVVGIIETRKLARMPREALENGWQGNTVVLIKIGADGNIAEVSTAKSSGYDLLDGTARTGASRAKQFVPVPAALRGKAFEIRGDIVFRIVDK